MSTPLLSIIVPVYNVENHLRRCIDSLLSQNYKNVEIILVDDGSTDNSGSICDEYQIMSPLIRVLHQENQGLSGARNTGLEEANGAYIGFIDSDDWVNPNFYLTLMNVALKGHYDVVSGIYQRIENNKQIKIEDSIQVEKCNSENAYCKFLSSAIKGGTSYVPVWTKIYRKETIGDIRFDPGVFYEDIAFNWKIISRVQNGYAFCNCSGYYYFVNKNSITKALQRKFNYKILDYVNAAEEIKKYYIEHTKEKNNKILLLLNTFIIRAHYSVLFNMLRSKCSDKELVRKEIAIVKSNFSLLWRSSLSSTRKVMLLFFKLVPQNFLVKYINN